MNRSQLKGNALTPMPSTIRNVQRGILTTGDCAFFCRVAPRTISIWIDTGIMKGIRLPNRDGGDKGGDRRVRVEDLITFMKSRKIPLHPLLIDAKGIWCVGFPNDQTEILKRKLQLVDPKFLTLTELFGNLLHHECCEWLMLGCEIPRNQRQEIIDLIAGRVSKQVKIVVFLQDDETEETKEDLIKLNKVWHDITLMVTRYHSLNWDIAAIPQISGSLILTESKLSNEEVA